MSVLNLVIFVIIGLTVGTCIVTAQYFGSGDMGMLGVLGIGTYIWKKRPVVCLASWVGGGEYLSRHLFPEGEMAA